MAHSVPADKAPLFMIGARGYRHPEMKLSRGPANLSRLLPRTTAWHFCLIAGLVVLSHWQAFLAGGALVHSDFAPSYLGADDVRSGEISAFYFGMPYAGATLAPLRAAWCAVYEFLSRSPLDYIESHSAFSFFVLPFLLACGAYFLSSRFLSRGAALVAALFAAADLHFMVGQYGNDPYIAYLALGSLLLALRADRVNPWTELTPSQLVVAGAVAGLAVYTSRICLIYLVAFAVPWQWVRSEAGRLLASSGRTEKCLIAVGTFLLGLFVYLEVFGPDLGEIFGRRVRLHAHPNLHLALLAFGAAYVLRNGARARGFKLAGLRPFVFFAAGLSIGFLPEAIHWLRLGVLPPAGTGEPNGFPAFMANAGSIPSSLAEILTAGKDLGRVASILLGLAGLWALARLAAREPRRLQGVACVAVLAALAYCRIRTYTNANPRYLLPILPVLWVGVAALWESARARPPAPRRWASAAVGALLLAHLAHQGAARASISADPEVAGRLQRSFAWVEGARRAGFDLVFSDEYWWHSTNLAFLARRDPWFVPIGATHLLPPNLASLVSSSRSPGALLETRKPSERPARIDIHGASYALEFVETIEDRDLYRARL